MVRDIFLGPRKRAKNSRSVSHRLRSLATDREVWKAKYYDTWTRSRTRNAPHHDTIDWKRQFKIKTNWAAGSARVLEVEIAQPPSPLVVCKVQKGLIWTVDRGSGLRLWSRKDGIRILKAQMRLEQPLEPTCIAVETLDRKTDILLGFSNGTFSMYVYDGVSFKLYYTQTTHDGPLLAVSLAMPYAMTISKTKFLSLYRLRDEEQNPGAITPVTRLQSDASFSPISLALRRAPGTIIATIAYSFNRLNSGWCMGLQEIRLNINGAVLNSRLASSLDTPFDSQYQVRKKSRWEVSTRSTSSVPFPLHPQLMSPPTSLSYEHPFLISTLADNTIMSFLVTSNEKKLEISTGRRLWGHTSAVSVAEVNNRGKAVSISGRGDEIRVWELETVMMSGSHSRTSTEVRAVDALSGVAVAMARRGSGLGLALHEMQRELELTRRWVGFDEEQVVVLGERDQKQIMALYDFT